LEIPIFDVSAAPGHAAFIRLPFPTFNSGRCTFFLFSRKYRKTLFYNKLLSEDAKFPQCEIARHTKNFGVFGGSP